MKGLKTIVCGLCAALVLSSCNMSNTGKGSLIGAGGGAALGAALGALIGGGSGTGIAIGAALGTAAGTTTGYLIGKKMDKAKAAAEQVANAEVTDAVDQNGYQAVKVTFDSGILFKTGDATLNDAARASLLQFATTVLKPNADMNVGIVGYTDNTPFKNSTAEQSAAKNQELSLKRAQSVSNCLLSQGVSSAQIKEVAGLGESNPVADNSTVEGKKQNRRVEVFLYASDEMIKAAQAEAAAQN